MIELPSGTGPYRPDDSGGPGPGHRRALAGLAAVAVLVLIVVVAVVNTRRSGSNAASRPGFTQPGPSSPGATAGPTQPSGGNAVPVPRVACPLIRDEQSHLAYRCIDNYLRQDGSDIYLGLRIALNHEVEPGWVISEGSGDPTSIQPPPSNTTVVDFHLNHGAGAGSAAATEAQVQAEVRRRTALALSQAYGPDPSSTTLSARTRVLAGVTGYELVTEIAIDPAFRQAQGLRVRTERLWTLGLPSPTGVSIFMMSIPDSRRDLWPQAEATVGTVHVI